MSTVLITGGSGFIGREVVRRTLRRLPGARLRLMTHHRPLETGLPPRATAVSGDLTAPESLRGLCEGVDVLLHCASQVGGAPELCERVNARGTAALMAEARRAGVRRVVQLSTAAVYGRGPFRDAAAGELTRDPVSATSRTRAAAEEAVLAAGGVVLRPHLVYGTGDRWVGPGLGRLLRILPGTVEQWSAQVSAIDVDSLADALVGVALSPGDRLGATVYHANHPQPVSCRRLLQGIAAAAGHPWPARDLTYEEACAHVKLLGRSVHDLDMVTTDHWFDSTPLWRDLGTDPGPGFPVRFPRYREWYEQVLRS